LVQRVALFFLDRIQVEDVPAPRAVQQAAEFAVKA
jgi:hypothetical protein